MQEVAWKKQKRGFKKSENLNILEGTLEKKNSDRTIKREIISGLEVINSRFVC